MHEDSANVHNGYVFYTISCRYYVLVDPSPNKFDLIGIFLYLRFTSSIPRLIFYFLGFELLWLLAIELESSPLLNIKELVHSKII